MKILVTGASGFIGSALINKLLLRNFLVRAHVRKNEAAQHYLSSVVVGNISDQTDWSSGLRGVDRVVHLAGRAHVMRENHTNSAVENRRLNLENTVNLAKQAAAASVKRFIFLSSIKVNGEFTELGKPFTTDDIPAPQDAYGFSKYEGEQALLQISLESEMEVVIIRPPLVYGPGVKGNFASLVNWVKRGVPLPLGSINNQRSLVALENLIDFIALCADPERSPRAANQVFLISDGEDVSTTELLHKVARAYRVSPRLVPVPANWIRAAASLVSRGPEVDRLLGSLVVDSSKARELLGWQPVITMDEQLKKMALHDSAA